jgi:hypothetical protein
MVTLAQRLNFRTFGLGFGFGFCAADFARFCLWGRVADDACIRFGGRVADLAWLRLGWRVADLAWFRLGGRVADLACIRFGGRVADLARFRLGGRVTDTDLACCVCLGGRVAYADHACFCLGGRVADADHAPCLRLGLGLGVRLVCLARLRLVGLGCFRLSGLGLCLAFALRLISPRLALCILAPVILLLLLLLGLFGELDLYGDEGLGAKVVLVHSAQFVKGESGDAVGDVSDGATVVIVVGGAVLLLEFLAFVRGGRDGHAVVERCQVCLDARVQYALGDAVYLVEILGQAVPVVAFRGALALAHRTHAGTQ